MVSRRRGERGFTLVEATVTLVVLTVAFSVVYQLFLKTQQSFYDEKALLEAQGNARLALEAISSDIRHASYGKDVTQSSVTFAGPDSIAFTADMFDSIPGAELVTIFLGADYDSGTVNPTDRVLQKAIYDTTGAEIYASPLSYGLADQGLDFRYYNKTGDTLSFPITQPDLITEVEISVTAETPREVKGAGFLPVTFTTTVFPRNLPFSPSKAKPSPPNCTGLTSPNCESLTVTWDTPTTYTDGTELYFNDISHFNVYYGTSPGNMVLDTRVARIVNEWTIADLDGATSYLTMVTCVTTSGTESGGCQQTGAPGGGSAPQSPSFATASTVGNAVTLNWGRVSQDVGGGQITATVTYNIYRSILPNDPPISANLIATEVNDSTYVDVITSTCGTFYYRISAVACGTEGAPTADAFASTPSTAACVTNVWAIDGPGFGEITIGWNAPAFRSDGSPLPIAEIAGYKVVYGTTSAALSDTTWISGGGTTNGLLTGLLTCTTYFVNVIAVDDCGNLGDDCAENQQTAWTTIPCDGAIPLTPTGLSATAGDTQIDLVWDTNKDCDIAGYKIYYDRTPGPPFNGTDANEGPSPIVLDFADAIVDSATSTASLTGMTPCERYYIAITAYDQCPTPNESPLSLSVDETVDCASCAIANACIAEYTTGGSDEIAHGDVANAGATDLGVEEMNLSWTSGQTLVRVNVDGVDVWAADGSSGQDGARPQPSSPAAIDVDDWTLPTSATDVTPIHIKAEFSGSALNDSIAIKLITGASQCGIVIQPCNIIFEDDFQDDPNGTIPPNWSPISGSWSIAANKLMAQGTSTSRIEPVGLPTLDDFTVESTARVTGTNSNRRAGLHFRYQDTGTYYLFRIYPGIQEATFSKKVGGGAFTDVAWVTGLNIFNNFNHLLRATASGNSFRFWIDGVPVNWSGGQTGTILYDTDITTGGVALYTRSVNDALFDNVKIYRTCGGCGP